jgi:membrane protease YdiL (CAAX protease family)
MPVMTNNWIRIAGAIVLEFLVAGLVLGLLAMGGMASVVLDSYVLSMIFAAVLGVLLAFVIILYAHRLGGVPLPGFAFAWNQHHARFALLVWLLTLGIAATYMWLLDQLGVRQVLPLTPQWGVILVGILGSLGTIHEEVLSRGYIMPLLHRRFNIPAVLLISAVIFTLIHIPTVG